MSTHPYPLETLLLSALEEDCPTGDITTQFFLNQEAKAKATLIAKASGIFFGKIVVETLFKGLQHPYHILWSIQDGQTVNPQDVICTIETTLPILLKAERVMLNFLQRLSGIATTTHAFVKALNNPKIALLDTRKTTPLYRFLEREAVKAGGGTNHRLNLSDMVLLKENHLTQMAHENTLNQLGSLMSHFKTNHPDKKIEIEIETLNQLETLDLHHADIIMLDNFALTDISQAVALCKSRGFKAKIEVSGNVTLETIGQFTALPIDRISVGSLTHSPKALDLSLLIQ